MGDNDQDRSEITIQTANNLLSSLRSGEADSGLGIAQMLLSEGPNFDPNLLLIIVEAVVELSAIAGSEEASEYHKEQWPILKKNHLRRLSNKQK